MAWRVSDQPTVTPHVCFECGQGADRMAQIGPFFESDWEFEGQDGRRCRLIICTQCLVALTLAEGSPLMVERLGHNGGTLDAHRRKLLERIRLLQAADDPPGAHTFDPSLPAAVADEIEARRMARQSPITKGAA